MRGHNVFFMENYLNCPIYFFISCIADMFVMVILAFIQGFHRNFLTILGLFHNPNSFFVYCIHIYVSN